MGETHCGDRYDDFTCTRPPQHSGLHQCHDTVATVSWDYEHGGTLLGPAEDYEHGGTLLGPAEDYDGARCGDTWGEDVCELTPEHDGNHTAYRETSVISWWRAPSEPREELPEVDELEWLDALLHGIDLDEGASCPQHPDLDCGWWPTSRGAVFGGAKLEKLRAEITERYL